MASCGRLSRRYREMGAALMQVQIAGLFEEILDLYAEPFPLDT